MTDMVVSGDWVMAKSLLAGRVMSRKAKKKTHFVFSSRNRLLKMMTADHTLISCCGVQTEESV
jgi:DeoR/GlpR family transcriptional regulator of sugar metabolism